MNRFANPQRVGQDCGIGGFRDLVGNDISGDLQLGYDAGEFLDVDLGGGEELEFEDVPFHGHGRSTLQVINPFVWQKVLIKYFIILA